MTESVQHAFDFPLNRGLHARPAAGLRRLAQRFDAACHFRNDRNGRTADLRDLLSLIATDTGAGDPCRLTFEGAEAVLARGAFASYLGGAFLEADGEPHLVQGSAMGTVLRRLLDAGATGWHPGMGLAPGIGLGPVRLLGDDPLDAEPLAFSTEGLETEQRRVAEGLSRTEAELASSAMKADHTTLREILEAHGAMLQDRPWRASIGAGILERGLTARSAVLEAGRQWMATLRGAGQPLLRDRSSDVRDLTARLLRALGDGRALSPRLRLDAKGVVVARELSLSQFLSLDLGHVAGLVVTECGPTSHLAILARTFGIPLVGGVDLARHAVEDGTAVLVDGRRGLVVLDPQEPVLRYEALEHQAAAEVARRMRQASSAPARTADGQALTILANLSLAEEAAGAFALGAEGVGLFRTETLCLRDAGVPDEASQTEVYRQVLAEAQGRPVTLRLLDIGGDKPVPGLDIPREANPFLGLRAVRWYASRAEVIRTQLRAALAASPAGDLRLLVPMVSTREELAWVRGVLQEVASEQGLPCPPLGVMVEVPALALQLPTVADLADFFCVGTNDLVQYLFAADRSNPAVARREHHWHPATLRLLDLVVREAARLRRPLSLCGEMAGDRELLPLLAGLGFRTLSVAPPEIPPVKRALEAMNLAEAEALARQALQRRDAAGIRALLEAFRPVSAQKPLVEPELVVLGADCASREEALWLLVQRLFVAGRTEAPDVVEEAVWARECVVATCVGRGYAVPHCQTAALTHPSLALLRLRQAVPWGEPGSEPVHTVILLALPGEEARKDHLRLFAHLARSLMREAFRGTLEALEAPGDVASFIAHEIEGLL